MFWKKDPLWVMWLDFIFPSWVTSRAAKKGELLRGLRETAADDELWEIK